MLLGQYDVVASSLAVGSDGYTYLACLSQLLKFCEKVGTFETNETNNLSKTNSSLSETMSS